MKDQQVIITDSEKDINDKLGQGWTVVSVTAQHVSASSTHSPQKLRGKFCFVIERK